MSTVKDISNMFEGCSYLERLDISGWDISKVQDMNRCFAGCKSLSSVDTSLFASINVARCKELFAGTPFENGRLPRVVSGTYCGVSWRVEGEQLIIGNGATQRLEIRIIEDEPCPWESSSIRSVRIDGLVTCSGYLGSLFRCMPLVDVDLTGLDTSEATSMRWMFCDCTDLKRLDLSMLNTSNVEDMDGMFCDCRCLEFLDISGFDTSHVKSMSFMFNGCVSLKNLDISHFDMSNVMESMGMLSGVPE